MVRRQIESFDITGDDINDSIQRYIGISISVSIIENSTIFRCPGSTHGAISTKMQDTVSGTDLHPCAKFQPNPFSSFGVDVDVTNRQTDTQTANIISAHYHGTDNKK